MRERLELLRARARARRKEFEAMLRGEGQLAREDRVGGTGEDIQAGVRDEAEEDDPTLRPTLCSSMAICYSALLTLYDAYSCTERMPDNVPETQLFMQQESIDGLSEISAQVMILARRVRSFVEQAGSGRLSPFTIDSLYQAAANCEFHIHRSVARLVSCYKNLTLYR